MFRPLSDQPDHRSLEPEQLARWDEGAVFERLRMQTADGPRFSFIDGPVTANKSLGVHTAWGRTLKDVHQRYQAMTGHSQRYQNGFDCQGLWIEVGVERELGLNSKREIEAYGLEEFAARCREKVVRSAEQLVAGSRRLGMWMDWDASYFTFSDVNIEYIWRFLQVVNERGWLYRGHRATEWCPRCGTSISAHELVGSYIDKQDPSLFVRFPLTERPGEFLVIWTTTPWTLPANVAAAVNPDAEYALVGSEWRARALVPESRRDDIAEVRLGSELAGWPYAGPFDHLEPGATVTHRVITWDEVQLDEGSGIVHIAPGCGTSDFAQGQLHHLPLLTPIDEAGNFFPEYGWLSGISAHRAADRIIADLRERGLLVAASVIEHRYPECWRCHTPLVFRVADDWFISVDEVREPMRAANRDVEWVPEYMGKRMDDWLVNMSDWNISRRRYYGMPLPFYPCNCGHLTVIGSRAELAQRAADPLDGLRELRRPWIDRVRVRCERCDQVVDRVAEVGDVWLDAGIVPFSTLGWENDQRVPAGFGTGAAAGLTAADLPDHTSWQEWFPADLVSEMREQIRLWFYSLLFMSVTLVGTSPYKRVLGYERMLDVRGREMHGSHGNMISADDAIEHMGADVMRWLFCSQPPNQDLWFGFEPGAEVKNRLITNWNSVKFFIQYANLAGFTPRGTGRPESGQALDAWMLARTDEFVHLGTRAYDQMLTVDLLRAYESYLEDMSNWYIRRSRRRFWDGDHAALGVLWWCLVTSTRIVSPVLPFIADHLWQVLTEDVPECPDSVFLAGWPEHRAVDSALIHAMARVRQVVNLGHQGRAAAQLKVRQPLRRAVIEGADDLAPYVGLIADELRVKEVVLGTVAASRPVVRPNLRRLGPRLGSGIGALRARLQDGDFTELAEGRFRVGDLVLEAEDVLVSRSALDGWQVTGDDSGLSVAIDLSVDDALRRESRVYDLLRAVNALRRSEGLEISDRIELWLAPSDADLLPEHADWISRETLALSIAVGAELTLAKSPDPSPAP